MKKVLTSLVIIFSLLSSGASAQTAHPFELGFNAGASWLKSDIKMKKLGPGWGITFGQMYRQNKTNAIDWGWRFRYLNAVAYGQDTKRSNGIAKNTIFNGSTDSTLNYFDNGGFVYQNYKTKIDEVSLELVLGANRMRENYRVYPYIFGGLGLTKAVARTNQLDDLGLRYNYIAVDSNNNASAADVLSNLNSTYDGSYETAAEGNANPRWKLMPSLGVGLGFEVVKGFSIGVEHKVTWALNDVIDGQQWTNANTSTGDNDQYHYSSVWLKFSFGKAAKSNAAAADITPPDVNTYTTTAQKPTVTFTNPAASPASSGTKNMSITAALSNISSKSDIYFVVNGNPDNGFTYDSYSKTLSYNATLLNGSNTFQVTATNSAGSAEAIATVVYTEQVSTSPAPVVKILNPSTSPYTTDQGTINVSGTVMNISSQSQLQVAVNGVTTGSFTYNNASKAFNINSNLVQGANTFVITASNEGGSDSKSTIVIFKQEVAGYSTPAPVVNITLPAVSPFTTNVNNVTVNAQVLNVTSASQVSVMVNGSNTSSFTFNAGTHQLSLPLSLLPGANSVTVSGTNAAGSDSKTTVIVYNPPATAPAPVVTILSPAPEPFTTMTSPVLISANVQYVTAIGQVAVSVNGGPVPASQLTFNAVSGQLSFNANLAAGANTVSISATNVAGSDSKTKTIIYQQAQQVAPPVVTITSPGANPYTSSSASVTVTAKVQNVTSSAQISVMINGAATTAFSFNAASAVVSLTPALVNGNNTISISATNAGGSDSKTQNVIYKPVASLPKPAVTITSPAANPFTSTMATATVNASVLNVSSSSQITVTVNGSPTTAFSFNAASHQLTMSTALITGANSVTITAVNASGSDSKTQTIIYQPAAALPKPVVSIVSPASSPFTSAVTPAAITANIQHVTVVSQIAVTVNGGPVPTSQLSFNSSSGSLSFNANLTAGSNTVVVSATNVAGSDSKTQTIIYMPVAALPKPVVTITTPAPSPFNTSVALATVSATVMNVSTSSQISVTVNGVATTAFSFNATTHILSLPLSLIPGANTLLITATNASGSDTKSKTIIYTQPAPPIPAPVVSFVTPASGSAGTQMTSYAVEAKVLNVTTPGQITVKVNGTSITAFTFVASSNKLTFTANLIPGANSVVISATNTSGTDTKTATITHKVRPGNTNVLSPDSLNTPVGPTDPGSGGGGASTGGPQITLITPSSTPSTTSDAVFSLVAKVEGIASPAEVSLKLNGVVQTSASYTVKTKMLNAPLNLVMGANSVIITAGTKTQTLIIIRQ